MQAEEFGEAKVVAEFNVAEQLECQVLELQRSGLTIVHAKRHGPVVSGAFAIATEPPDDSGLPHTLEHLVFLGSRSYPHKGILDVAANRSFAHGTNAWTAKDHTAYTIETAGPNGFTNVAPALFDHVLNPLLTDDGYVTEVHHVKGDGEDGGVVYNELQGRESAAEELSGLAIARALFPEGCGYRYESGGTKEAVRSFCSPDRVREYHQARLSSSFTFSLPPFDFKEG